MSLNQPLLNRPPPVYIPSLLPPVFRSYACTYAIELVEPCWATPKLPHAYAPARLQAALHHAMQHQHRASLGVQQRAPVEWIDPRLVRCHSHLLQLDPLGVTGTARPRAMAGDQ